MSTATVHSWIESSSVAGAENCGDFASCLDLAPHRRAIIVGDIAGRGPGVGAGAAALYAFLLGLVRRGVAPAEALGDASDFYVRNIMSEAAPFASLFIAVADLRESVVQYASAGHEPALLFNRDASAHGHLDPTGPVLGLEAASVFSQQTLPLFRDALLAVVTDGITDARRRAGDELSFFGTTGVARAVRDAVRNQLDPAQEVYRAAVQHAGGRLADDACVVVSSLASPNRSRLRRSAS